MTLPEGALQVLTECDQLQDLSFEDVTAPRHDFSSIKKLKNLRRLKLDGNGVSLLDIGPLPQLEELRVPDHALSKAEIRILCQSTKLRHLTMDGSSLGDDDVEQLVKLRELETLDFGSLWLNGLRTNASNKHLTSASLCKLRQLLNLREIKLPMGSDIDAGTTLAFEEEICNRAAGRTRERTAAK